jgi:hypothetical protein
MRLNQSKQHETTYNFELHSCSSTYYFKGSLLTLHAEAWFVDESDGNLVWDTSHYT